METKLTLHARMRIRQRGFRERDVDLILEQGTLTHDGVILTRKHVADLVADYRRKIADLTRLSGAAVFSEDGVVVSIYRPDASKFRRMTSRPSRRRPRGPKRRHFRGLQP